MGKMKTNNKKGDLEMNPEVKALKSIVEKFGTIQQQLNQDYIKFKDWFDKIIAENDFGKVMTEHEKESFVDVEVKKLKNKNVGEIKDMLNEVEDLIGADEDDIKAVVEDSTKRVEQEKKKEKGLYDFDINDIEV